MTEDIHQRIMAIEQRFERLDAQKVHLERQVVDMTRHIHQIVTKLNELCVEVQVTRARMLTSAAITAFLLTTGLTVIALLVR